MDDLNSAPPSETGQAEVGYTPAPAASLDKGEADPGSAGDVAAGAVGAGAARQRSTEGGQARARQRHAEMLHCLDAATDEPDSDDDPWPKPLGPAAFHGLAGEIVSTILPHSEADGAALLAQFLAAFGSAIGRDGHALIEGDHHAGNVYVAIVGASSASRKGTSWGRIGGLVKRADPAWAAERILNGLSTGEGLIHHVRDPVETTKRTKEPGTEPSYETVVVDQGVEDKRLMVVESELGRTFRVMGREGNTLSAVLRQAWDGTTLCTMTKTSPARATEPHVSLIGHITPNELRGSMGRVELANGLTNRFLFVCARRSKYLPEGGTLSQDAIDELGQRLRQALETAGETGRVERDDPARELGHSAGPQRAAGSRRRYEVRGEDHRKARTAMEGHTVTLNAAFGSGVVAAKPCNAAFLASVASVAGQETGSKHSRSRGDRGEDDGRTRGDLDRVAACSHGYPDNGPAALGDEVTQKAVVARLTDVERHKYWRLRPW
jgi:hypothetical protein